MRWLKKKEKSKGAMESEYAKLAKERERLQLKRELEERKREIGRLKHPYQEEVRKGAKRAGGRLGRFAGGLIREGVRSYGKTRDYARRRRTRIRKVTPRRTFVAPDGQDISLSGAIARSDWDAGKNIMTTEFFSSDVEPKDKDFFGEKKLDNLVGSKKKQKYF